MTVVDLSRRFRELTKSELEDSEALLSLADAGLLKSMSWADAMLHPRVVLLAEAGSGKTFEMRERARQLRAEGKPAFFLPLEALDEGRIADLLTVDDERAFNSWRTDDQSIAWLFLDAVDELKLTQGKLERVLRRVAKEIDGCLHRVHIVISCRPTDWRPSLDLAALRDAFPTAPLSAPAAASEELFLSALREHERAKQSEGGERSRPSSGETSFVILLPLDQTQIEAFARAQAVADVAAFMAELRKQNAWSFARRPLDLSELIATWKGQGRLGTRAEQHEANVVARLKDDPDRPDQGLLTDVELRVGAERLALALSLTRTLTIRAPELSVDVDHALGVLDSSLILPDWSEEKRQALLRRALFDPATYGRVKFHHRSVQEYLSARRLDELRKRGMSTKALCRLLFAERYGVPVVIPSMRPIAAWLALWDRHVQRELIQREPETLLATGDPETLPIPARAELLRAFAQCYGSGGWRGLRIPLEEIRRLAHPELGSVVLELWGQGPTNEDVRELLLDLMDQGRMHACVSVCEQAARDVNLPEHHRAMAVRVLVTCGQEAKVQEIVKSIVHDRTSWPAAFVAGLVDDLFPSALTAADVIGFVEMSSGRRERSGLAQALRRIATTIEPLSSTAVELRDLLGELIWRGREATEDWAPLSGRFDNAALALAALCCRQIEANPTRVDVRLIHASAIASRFGDDETGGKDALGRLRQQFRDSAGLRSEAFWIEFALMESVDSSGDPGQRLRRTQRAGLVGEFSDLDWDWLLRVAADAAETATVHRGIAVRGLLLLWVRRGRLEAEGASLAEAVNDNANLTDLVRAWRVPPDPDDEIEKLNRRDRERRAVNEAREQRRLADWQAWRANLMLDPGDAFASSNQLQTIKNLYIWLNGRDRDSNHRNVWDRDALASVFSNEVAERARVAFQELWRAEQPSLWSERAPQERNSVFYTWVYGLCGIAAEAESPGWATRLSAEEARRASSYAPIELNGLPAWLKDLVAAHPSAVDAVLGNELEAELALTAEQQYLPLLQNVAYGDAELKRLLAPRVLQGLETWPEAFASEQAGSSSSHHLDQALRVLDEVTVAEDRKSVATKCQNRFKKAPSGPLAMVWLRGVFRFAPNRGIAVLEAGLASTPEPERATQARAALAGIFGERGSVGLDLASLSERAAVLGALVRIAYEFVRPADDQEHEGAYSPNARDEAERARAFLLSALLDTPGAEAQRILLELSASSLFAHIPDRLRLLARERAAKDAERPPLTPAECVALEKQHEAPPHDRDGLFDVMVDRLDDLAIDISDHDFTDRRTLQTITEEVEMQRTLARRLEGMARGAYTVTRETEVADAKRTDGRLAAMRGDQKATVEIKIADKGWSVADLEHALREQLFGQYLRHDTCKAGCLLLTFNGRKKHWEHPETGTPMSFTDVVEHLATLARTIEAEQSYSVRLAVRGLDLRDPLQIR